MSLPHSGTQGWWRAGAEQKAQAQLVFDCSWCVQDVQAGCGKPRSFTKGIPPSAQCTTGAYCSSALIAFLGCLWQTEMRTGGRMKFAVKVIRKARRGRRDMLLQGLIGESWVIQTGCDVATENPLHIIDFRTLA